MPPPRIVAAFQSYLFFTIFFFKEIKLNFSIAQCFSPHVPFFFPFFHLSKFTSTNPLALFDQSARFSETHDECKPLIVDVHHNAIAGYVDAPPAYLYRFHHSNSIDVTSSNNAIAAHNRPLSSKPVNALGTNYRQPVTTRQHPWHVVIRDVMRRPLSRRQSPYSRTFRINRKRIPSFGTTAQKRWYD